MITFNQSEVKAFNKLYHFKKPGQRYGQSFYSYFQLHKHQGEDKIFFDRLYNERNEAIAKSMIAQRTDTTQ